MISLKNKVRIRMGTQLAKKTGTKLSLIQQNKT